MFMKKLAVILGMAPLLLGATLSARADTLNITATGDNQFTAYLSTSDSVRGTLIGANNPSDADWKTAVSLNTDPLAGTPLYLHVVLVNWTPDTKPTAYPQYPYGPGNPSAFLADLKITGSSYAFADGSQAISTSTALYSGTPIWTASAASAPNAAISDPNDSSSWLLPTNPVLSSGTNGDTTTIWYQNRPGSNPDITLGAEWIYFGDQGHNLYTDLSVELLNTQTGSGATPLPAAWTMMLLGLAGGGAVRTYRRKRAKA